MEYKDLTPELTAKLLHKAMEIREGSFDDKAADAAEKRDEIVNFTRFYRLSFDQSIKQTMAELEIDPRFERFIYLSFHWANDVLEWADEILKKEGGDPG